MFLHRVSAICISRFGDGIILSEQDERTELSVPGLLEKHPELKEALDAGDFERAFRFADAQSLEVPSAYWVELGENALRKGKYVFARTALGRVGEKQRQQAHLYLSKAAQLYEQHSYDDAARELGYAAVLFPDHGYPIAFQYTAWQLHERCNPQVEGGCVFERVTLESIRAGLSYLGGSSKIISEFESQISAQGNLARLVLPLGAFWDNRQGDCTKKFREVFGKLASAAAREFEEFQINLLGRKLHNDFAEIYFREICAFHPLMALMLCKKAIGRRFVLRPVLVNGDTILTFFENPKPLSEAPLPKKPSKK
jgi:hypothetical protein